MVLRPLPPANGEMVNDMSIPCSADTRRNCPDPVCARIDGCRHDYRDMAQPVRPDDVREKWPCDTEPRNA